MKFSLFLFAALVKVMSTWLSRVYTVAEHKLADEWRLQGPPSSETKQNTIVRITSTKIEKF